MLTGFLRALWARHGDADRPGPSFDPVVAALAAGDPRRAAGLLDGAADAAAAVPGTDAELRALTASLSGQWWPGPIGATIDDPGPAPPAPPAPPAGPEWIGQVLPTSLYLRALTTGARRAGPEQADTLFRGLVAPYLVDWHRAAVESGDAAVATHVVLLCAELGRRAGLSAFAREALDEAAGLAALAGPAVVGAHRLAEGDALLTPLGSPETLGIDLEAREAPPALGGVAERVAAATHFRAARAAFVDALDVDGTAEVDLRLAWLARLDGDTATGVDVLRAALTGGAGGALRMLLLAHLAVADLVDGRSARTRPGPVPELVGWAAGPGSRSFAIGCAGIVHATAVTLRDTGRVEAALAGFDLANRLMEPLRDRSGGLALASDLGTLYDRLNSSGATVATVEQALEAATAPYGGFAGAGPIPVVDWQRIGDGLMTLHKRHLEEGDPGGLEELDGRLRVLLARAPGGPREVLRPDVDFLVVVEAAKARLAELGAARAGPFGGGLDWAELEAGHVDLTVASLSSAVVAGEAMVHRCRAERAGERGDRVEADREFAAALAVAGPSRIAMSLGVLASWGRRAELRARTAEFLEAGPRIDPEYAAMLWLNADEPDRAHAVLVAAGRVAPEASPAVWRPAWDGCTLRARIALGRGRPQDATALIAEAADRFESWFASVPGDAFRVAVLDDGSVRRLYQVAAAARLAEGDMRGAFAAADRARTLSLGSLVAEAAWIARDPGAGPAFRAWRQARAEWTGAFDRRRAAWRLGDPAALRDTAQALAGAQARVDGASTAVERVAPGVTGRRPARLPDVTAEEVGAVLDPETVVVEYVMGDRELLVLTVTAGSCHGRRTELDVRALQGAVHRLHADWSGAAPAESGGAADLADTLLGPVRPLLDEHARVVVVPHRTLHLLPFHALPLGGRPLGAEHVVSQIPAASLIPRLAGRPGPRLDSGSLVVGDPATDPGRGLRRLPGARVEAVAVARALGAEALTGSQADERTVRARLGRAGGVAHLAVHGLLDAEAPQLSALVLAGQDELTVAELLGVGLDTDLAVLSACDSGRGEITATGDVVGLARGLLAAGVRHSVVSLWPVDDRTACLTMVAMAEGLAVGQPVAEALAAAQHAVRAADTDTRDRWYAGLAAAADASGTTGGRRTRDARVSGPPRDLPADHPSWWAPFVHVGL